MGWVRSGTVETTAGSKTINGTGTNWVGNVDEGEGISINGGHPYEIDAVVSDTEMRLVDDFPTTLPAVQTYVIRPYAGVFERAATALSNARATLQTYIDTALKGLFTSGTLADVGIGFVDKPNTGLILLNDQDIGVVVNGVLRATFKTTGLDLPNALSGAAVQSNATDATANRLMQVGAFGLGAGAPPSIGNFEVALRPGFYRYLEAAATGAPGPGSSYFGTAIVMGNGAVENGVQIIAARSSGPGPTRRVWIGRRATETGPIEWTELYTQSRIVGTVVDNGGVVEGAAIERGANANGRYVRWADGSQECTVTITLNYITVGRIEATWTFPAPFIDPPDAVSGSFDADTKAGTFAPALSQLTSLSHASAGATSIVLRTYRVEGAPDFVPGDSIALTCKVSGRWK
ncbi:MAG: hypothetical protein QNJ09_11905 [Paracoccaceae bacterium]|nr:hypothetical protein [Paracoccaceae bacterium]